MQTKRNTGMWPLSNPRVSSIGGIDFKELRGKNTEMTCVPWEGTLLPSLKLSIPLAPYTSPTLMVLSFLEDIFP